MAFYFPSIQIKEKQVYYFHCKFKHFIKVPLSFIKTDDENVEVLAKNIKFEHEWTWNGF